MNRNNILARIQLDVSKSNIVYYKNQVESNNIIIVKRLDLKQMKFKLFNDKGTLFNLDPNQNVCLNLHIKPYA